MKKVRNDPKHCTTTEGLFGLAMKRKPTDTWKNTMRTEGHSKGRSLRNKHPLSRLSKEETGDVLDIQEGGEPITEFGKLLTKSDIERIRIAIEYYERTYGN